MRFAIIAAFSAACLTAPAHAADFNVNIIATNFQQSYPAFLNVPPPVTPVTFTGLLHLDITANVNPTTSGLAVQSFNLPYGVQYAYIRASDILVIGTYIDANFGVPSTPSSWFVAIGGAFYGSPFAYNFVQMVDQVQQGSPFTYSTTDVAINIVRLDVPANGVPEPATWAMMLLGFGAMGAAMRRRGLQVRFA